MKASALVAAAAGEIVDRGLSSVLRTLSFVIEREAGVVSLCVCIGERHAAVRARVDRREMLIVDGAEIVVAADDVEWLELPSEFQVAGPDGEKLRASGSLCITVETFDPHHLLCDVHRDRARLRR